MKKRVLIILLVLFLFPITCFALSSDYKDNASKITGVKTEKNIINVYLFHGKECPHCHEEKEWLKGIKEDYKKYIKVYYFEVWHNKDNQKTLNKIAKKYKIEKEGVPLTIIGDEYFLGFSETNANLMENKIKHYAGLKKNPNEIKLPIIGAVNKKSVSIPLVACILGFIDGFNPCAMWILLFLITMLINVKNKKRAWILGLTFLFVSALVYFLSMLGISLILEVTQINIIKILVGLFILGAGIYNFKKYIDSKNEEVGCTVVDDKKRTKIISKIKDIIKNKSFMFSMIGIITLAVSVNLIELACSLGFPLVFTELLNINVIGNAMKIIYMLIYILFYMIDDIFVFTVSMVTLSVTGITNKYSKACTLITSLLMIVMGLLMLFKPNILMFNF